MIPPSSLTMAVIAADAAADGKAMKALSIDDLNEHSFDWVAWLIILTACAIAAFGLAHLLSARRQVGHRRGRLMPPERDQESP